jgi:S1-C subfamily serine protease
MKKGLLSILIVFLFFLSSCTYEMTYEELKSTYDEHLLEQQSVYLERIAFLNELSSEWMKGVVRVKKTSSSLMSVSMGSGLIFDEDALYYYVLTNNHVIYDTQINQATFTIYDFQNNSYNATFVVRDSAYDLAVLKVRKKVGTDLKVISFAKSPMSLNEEVTTMGYPEGQLNAVHTGVLLDYGPVQIDVSPDIINVTFDVMIAELPLKSGSSGSAAVNSRFELVGLVFAGNFSNGKNLADYAFIIPINQVKTFLNNNALNYHEVAS